MFGSLNDFINVDLPLIDSRITTQQNQQDNPSMIDQMFKKRVNSNFNQYQPSDKTHLLAKFNMKTQFQKKNTSFLPQTNTRNYRSQSQRKPFEKNTSFFGRSEITKDYIAKTQLKRKHNLLRAIVRTNQNDNSNQGVSDYDQSFKRLYHNFQSIYAKPILEYKNFVIDESFSEMPAHQSVQVTHKPGSSLSHKKRIQYENCLNWARKHKKKGQFYQQQLGKHLKEKKEENINQGHSMMPEVQRKLRTLSHSVRIE